MKQTPPHSVEILTGDCRKKLRDVPDGSFDCCVTSPPYFGLRDYGHADQVGHEESPAAYVAQMVAIFREVRRTLRKDGTLWLNLGDSYAGTGKSGGGKQGEKWKRAGAQTLGPRGGQWKPPPQGFECKNLIGIPWRVAFALQEDGWILREDIIWAKPNCMPESVTDRCTRSHEYIFHFSKSRRYYHDGDSIKEPGIYDVDGSQTRARKADGKHSDKQRGHSRRPAGFNDRWDAMTTAEQCTGMRNKRSVWTVPPATYKEAHFATFPPALIQPCILAGSRQGGKVCDPFGGSGTTGQVALELGRSAWLCELNPEYVPLIRQRCATTPGLGLVTARISRPPEKVPEQTDLFAP